MKYTVKMSCGHEDTVALFGKNKERERKLRWYQESCVCETCYKEQKEIQRRREQEQVEIKSKEYGLPELSGTEKQIVYANQLRCTAVEKLSQLCEKTKGNKMRLYPHGVPDILVTDETIYDLLNFACERHTDAKFWIENGRDDISDLICKLIAEMDEYEKQNSIPEEIQLELLEEAEMLTVHPKNQTKKSVVEIKHAFSSTIELHYVKDFDFIKIVKSKKYKWSGEYWYRKINSYSGPLLDREAEIGNALLVNGFSVKFSDMEAKEKACEGTFSKEQVRWVKFNVELNKLVLCWEYRNNTIYQAARKLTSARWGNSSMLVGIAFYEEVQDFAKTFDFSFSKEAIDAINKEIKRVSLYETQEVNCVKDDKISDEERLRKSLMSSGTILEDLIDDDIE